MFRFTLLRPRARGRVPVVALFALFAAGVAASSDAPPDRLWPLDIEPAVSSSFCEYREGHLHAGIDIRSYGREGIPCLAAEDGYVSRLRVSPTGYGKAIYIQLHSGEILVYAHLAEFAPAMEEAVYEEQSKRRRYTVDFRIGPERFPVQRGDVVGYSGRTGASAPHLHFEIRDAGENPMNPFSHGFSLSDRLAPAIPRVLLMPLSAAARVNGAPFPVELDTRRDAPDRFTLADTVTLSGPVGLAVEVVDRLNAASGRLAPYRVELTVADRPAANITLERFSFGHTDEVDFLYHIGKVRMRDGYFIQLFEREGESLWDRQFADGGRLGVGSAPPRRGGPPGGAEPDRRAIPATVTASDRAGNTSTLRLYFRHDDGEVAGGHTAAAGELPGVYIFDDVIAVDGVAARRVGGAGKKRAGEFAGSASELMGAPAVVRVSAPGFATDARVVGLRAGRPRDVSFEALGFGIGVSSESLYKDQVVYAAPWPGDPATLEPGHLRPRSAPVQLGPYSLSLRADFTLRFDVEDADSTFAVYRLNEMKGTWTHYASDVGAGTVTTTAKRPGVYAVLSDATGPDIGTPVVREHVSYATGKGTPQLIVPVDDDGAGVDYRRTTVFVDGIEQIARWDGFDKKIFVLLRDGNIIGPRAVSVVAYDNVGNRSQRDATLNGR